jgi:hypothetical protein
MNCSGCGWCCLRIRCAIRSELWPGYSLPSRCPGLRSGGGRYWCGPLLDAEPEQHARWKALVDLGGGCRRDVQKNLFRIPD